MFPRFLVGDYLESAQVKSFKCDTALEDVKMLPRILKGELNKSA